MSQATPPSAAVGRVAVLATVRQAYAIVLNQPVLLARAVAMPFLLSMLITGLTLATPAFPLASFVLAIASLVPYVLFGVAWSRLTLYGPAVGRPAVFPAWRARHWRYFGYLAVLVLILFGLVIPPLVMGTFQTMVAASEPAAARIVLIFVLGELAVIVAMALVMARLSFVFPAAAADEIYTWRHAWVHTRGQGLRVLATIVLAMLPAVAVLWAVAAAVGLFAFPEIDPAVVQEGADPDQVIRDYLTANAGQLITAQITLTAMSYLVLAIVMSAVSLAFRDSTGWVPAVAPPPSTV